MKKLLTLLAVSTALVSQGSAMEGENDKWENDKRKEEQTSYESPESSDSSSEEDNTNNENPMLGMNKSERLKYIGQKNKKREQLLNSQKNTKTSNFTENQVPGINKFQKFQSDDKNKNNPMSVPTMNKSERLKYMGQQGKKQEQLLNSQKNNTGILSAGMIEEWKEVFTENWDTKITLKDLVNKLYQTKYEKSYEFINRKFKHVDIREYKKWKMVNKEGGILLNNNENIRDQENDRMIIGVVIEELTKNMPENAPYGFYVMINNKDEVSLFNHREEVN